MSKIDLPKIKQELIQLQSKISSLVGDIDVALGNKPADVSAKAREIGSEAVADDTRIIEGVFDGQGMVGPDGKHYPVPANYASKSKLVEGDMLKLTIKPDGGFLFKQIGPIERQRLVGVLAYDEGERQFFGVANDKSYLLLTASVTYYKGEVGDEVIMLVPEDEQSTWAAVENIVKQLPVNETAQKNIKSEENEEVTEAFDDAEQESEDTPLADEMVATDDEGQPLFDEDDDEFKIL